MNGQVGQPERATQNRVIALFRDELGYRYLGDWTDRDGNSNIEESLLSAWLTRRGYTTAQISVALHKLRTEADNHSRTLCGNNQTAYNLLRYGVPVKIEAGTEGAPPSERMEVRLVYDDGALFVGARMYSQSGAAGIQAPLGRRDEVEQAEYLLIALDTYLDRRTAHCFGVTASGVRLDHYHSTDSESDTDAGFDPVWQARTQTDEEGWIAELWIPFSQLRFNESPEQIWGLNIHRRTPTRNEDDYWVAIPRTERAWASRFGELIGIDAVKPPRRVELLPYFAAGSTVTGRPDKQDPFDDGLNLTRSVGLDAKVGIGPSLTLDATINPDFGQVEADPAEVNLSNFEMFFTERRSFFTTGSQLFAGGANNYFYSRRLGAVPIGSPSSDYVDHPRTATILGAAKLTGRLASGTSVGIIGAVTDEGTRGPSIVRPPRSAAWPWRRGACGS